MASSVVPYRDVLTLSEQAGVVTGRSDEEVRMLYLEWRAKHRPAENDLDLDEFRLDVFKENLRMVDEHNQAADRGGHTFRLRINQFADLTDEEFRARSLGNFSRLRSTSGKISSRYRMREGDDLPVSIDGRKKGAVVPVKDQGPSGCCRAYSTVVAVKGINQIEQELVDCDTSNHGCHGGYIDKAFNFIKNRGTNSEEENPFTGQQGTCNTNRQKHVASINSYEYVPSNDEKSLEPISVYIDASASTPALALAAPHADASTSKTTQSAASVMEPA